MKKLHLLFLLTILSWPLIADEFLLKTGETVFGDLVGIQNQSMYVLGADSLLTIIEISEIADIETSAGKVFNVWSKRKPFMKVDPSKYKQVMITKSDSLAYHADSEILNETSAIKEKDNFRQPELGKKVSWWEVGVAPLSSSPVSLDHWIFKWAKEEKASKVIRLKPSISYQTSTVNLEEENIYAKTNNYTLGIEYGVEFHKYITDRYSPYMGLLIHGSYQMGSYEYSQSGTSVIVTGAWLGNNGNPEGFAKWNIGISVVSGFDFYFYKSLYMGIEIGYGVIYEKNLDIVMEEESSVQGDYSYEQTTLKSAYSSLGGGKSASGLIKVGFRY